jgi:hypothetical protein
MFMTHSKILDIINIDLFICYFVRKQKVRGLYGYWTDSLYSIDIDYFEAFLKQQKKDLKNSSKNSQQQQITGSSTITTANGVDNTDADEELPDVDPSHEQLNLPPNSITLWRIIPKLEYAAQVKSFFFV